MEVGGFDSPGTCWSTRLVVVMEVGGFDSPGTCWSTRLVVVMEVGGFDISRADEGGRCW
jgi:hypothetical protein